MDGKQRLFVRVTETLQLAGEAFPDALRQEHKNSRVRKAPWASAGPTVYLIEPKVPAQGHRHRVILSGYLVLSDKSVVQFRAEANEEACKNRSAWMETARAILSHMSDGKVPLKCQAGLRRLHTDLGGKHLEVTLPQGYVVTLMEGVDFWVYYITPVVAYGSQQGGLLLYCGGHPSPRFDDEDGAEPALETMRTFLGKPATWRTWERGSGSTERKCTETMVTLGRDILHLYYSAPDTESMRVFEKIAQSMRLAEERPTNEVPEAKQPVGAN